MALVLAGSNRFLGGEIGDQNRGAALGHLAFEFFGIPAGHTFFSAVYLAVIGSALLRGKRAALLWVLWVFEALWLLGRAFS